MNEVAAPRLAPPPVPIGTERLTLRHIVTDDLEALRYYQDPEVCRYLPFPPADDAGLADRVAKMTTRLAPSEPDEVLALAVVHDEVMIGDVMLRLRTRTDPRTPPSVAEIGWAFAPSYAGRGFATEAATALVGLAFGHYPLHRLVAHLDPRNERSAALCERLGMTREAHLRRDWPEADGTWTDDVIYGLLREESHG
ncbi:GNAT family N-acetyltransferase [Nocardioides sp. HM23]|uniref:GNAT family N-acetyltransferase n=1 Tax=Nocardioides bizhenqiangii TaxID=3095076 RepID=UPI002ACAACFA|nr:GNAT family N-acetyltransferase [Nocardioides sp. HM23]MDZ5621323.1 GNAT family N-acetyltransferase [Nocardioides sp. HM23]